MDDVVGATLSTPRFTGVLLGVFAALALTLSAIGIYGVLSYVVSRRTREIGIRLAIGAGRGQVLRMVLRSGLVLSLAGIALGIAAAAFATRLMNTLLHGVTPGDPATFAAVGIGLSLCLGPREPDPRLARHPRRPGRGAQDGIERWAEFISPAPGRQRAEGHSRVSRTRPQCHCRYGLHPGEPRVPRDTEQGR